MPWWISNETYLTIIIFVWVIIVMIRFEKKISNFRHDQVRVSKSHLRHDNFWMTNFSLWLNFEWKISCCSLMTNFRHEHIRVTNIWYDLFSMTNFRHNQILMTTISQDYNGVMTMCHDEIKVKVFVMINIRDNT